VPVIPPGFGQCNVFYDLPGQSVDDAQVTFGIHPPAFTAALAEAIFQSYQNRFEEVLPTTYQILRVDIVDSGDLHYVSTGAAQSGTRAGAATAPQVAYLMKKRTALGGRKHTGRMYLPGVTESEVDEAGLLTPGILNDLQVAGEGFLFDLGAMDTSMVILHTDATAPTEVTALLPVNKVGTQRRRLDR